MPLEDAIDLMQAYARRGISDWKSAKLTSDQTRSRARILLKSRLAESEAETMHAIASIRGGSPRQLFIPMPKVNHKGIQHCFFLPFRGGSDAISYDLLLLCAGKNCLGFRFEPGQQGTHTYAHIQMNQKMLRGDNRLEIAGLPEWVPTSYPAFPLCAADPIDMFLSMTTSIHGYQGGVTDILKGILPPGPLQMYLKRLESHLAF